VLYVIIAISFGSVFYKIWTRELPWVVGIPFALNLFFNLIFSPLQFGLKSNVLAAIDILLVLATLVWAIVVIYPQVKWIAYAQIPYLLWVLFATGLQLTITYLNL
jgi:tryptophan-rich sensory protein